MHDWLVRLVLEVAVPSTSEVWSRPCVHLFELVLSRSNLNTSINAISCERASAFDIPFIEDAFLRFRVTTNKVVETLRVYCC